MRLWKSWIIARKDMTVIRRKKSFMLGLLGIPVLLGIAFPLLVRVIINRRGFSAGYISTIIAAFGFFFMIFAVALPLYISSYSMVGEKIERSLEPLLATPTSDGEILMGKYLGNLIPSLLALYLGALVYMVLIDITTAQYFHYLFYPDLSYAVQWLIGVPIASTYGITLSVFVSSKVGSAQAAYQGGAITLIPFFVLYIMGEIGYVSLNDTTNILLISAGLLVVAVVTYFVSRATFGREKILTQWK